MPNNPSYNFFFLNFYEKFWLSLLFSADLNVEVAALQKNCWLVILLYYVKSGGVFIQSVCLAVLRNCLPYAERKNANVIYSYIVFGSNSCANIHCKIRVFITVLGKVNWTLEEFRIRCTISFPSPSFFKCPFFFSQND